MAYVNTTPQPTDTLNQNQPEFLSNFISLQDYFAVNHFTFGDPNEGKHRMLTFPNTIFNAPAATEVVVNGQLSPYTNLPELSYSVAGFGGLRALLTARQFPLQASPSWAIIGGSGLIMKWGRATCTGFGIIAFPDDNNVSIPRFNNAPYCVMLSPIGINNNDIWIRFVGSTAVTFSVNATSRTQANVPTQVPFYYLAIGN